MEWPLVSLAAIVVVAAITLCSVLAAAFNPNSEVLRDLVQYALILTFVAIVVIVALLILGPNVERPFSTVNRSLCFRPCPTPMPTVPPVPWWQFWDH